MAAYKGTHWTQVFAIQDEDGDAVDLTGMTFEADIRVNVDSDDVLVNLTSGNGGFTLEDADSGRLRMSITAEQTEELPEGSIVFDVHHANASPGPVFMFRAKLKVKQSVTRDE